MYWLIVYQFISFNRIHQYYFIFFLLIFFIWFNVSVPKYFSFRVVYTEELFFSLLLLEVLHYAMSLMKTVSEYNSSQHLFTVNIKIICHVAQFFPLAQLLDTCPNISHWSPFTTGLSFTSTPIYVVEYD